MPIMNPSTISFRHPTEFVDGTPFGAGDYVGTEFAYREAGGELQLTVAIPVAFTTEVSTVPLSDLELPNGELSLAARTVAANGLSSEWSGEVSFTIDRRMPNPPFSLQLGFPDEE